jgi:hypothetical protein
MQVQSKSLNGVKGSCFEIRLEYNPQYMIVHLPVVEKMTRDIFLELKFLLEDWSEFFKMVGYKGIHAVVEPDSKAEKLAKMLNFELLGDYQSNHILIYKD